MGKCKKGEMGEMRKWREVGKGEKGGMWRELGKRRKGDCGGRWKVEEVGNERNREVEGRGMWETGERGMWKEGEKWRERGNGDRGMQ